MSGILCVGEMVIDFLPGQEAASYIRKPGGAPANVAVAAARNGVPAGFCGRVGDDDFGRFLMSVLKENNVQALCPDLVQEAITTMAFVSLDEHGDRSFTFARKPGADMFLTRENVDQAFSMEPAVVHAGSCSLSKDPAADATAYAMEKAAKAGIPVSFDVNYRNLMWNDDRSAAADAIQKVLPFVDYLKISEEEEDLLGGTIEAVMAANRISVLVKTLGADGALCYFGGKTIRIPGRKANCVDTTGAGDAFWGGFLSTLIKAGLPAPEEELLTRALTYGNIAGWLCVQKKGAMESLPTTAEVEAILEAEA